MNNFDTNYDFIQARYDAAENQYDLELFAAAPETMDTGASGESSGTSSSGALSTNPIFIQPAGGGQTGGGIGCPRIDQYVLAKDANGIVVAKTASFITERDFLYNPITETFHKVAQARIMRKQKCIYLASKGGAQTVVSATHPIICALDDDAGTKISLLQPGQEIVVCRRRSKASVDTVFEILPAADADVMRISLLDGFIYATGLNPNRMILGHNLKPDTVGIQQV